MTSKSTKRAGANCEVCPLRDVEWVPSQVVEGPDLPVFFIGQNPGSTEVVTKVPFTGRAGKMAYRLFAEAGLNKRRLNIGNLIGCPTPDDREPTPEEVACCSSGLQKEILALKPKLIVAMGKPSLKALVGRRDILKIRGALFPLLSTWGHECEVLVTLHPSFVMRQRQWIEHAVKDLKKVTAFFLEKTNIPLHIEVGEAQPEFILDPNERQLTDYLTSSDDVTAFDLETTGLNPRQDKILGISFCNRPDQAMAIYYRQPFDSRRQVVNWWLSHKKFKKCTQNGSFDCAFEKADGVNVEGLAFDTRLAEHLLNSELPTNLSFLREAYTNHKPYKPSQKEMENIIHMPVQKVLEINCWDAHVTYDVMNAQLKQLTPGNLKVLNEIYIPLVFALNYMERVGVRVDVDCLAALYADIMPKADQLREELFYPVGLNPNSPVQLTKYFGTKDCREDTLAYHIKRGHTSAALMQGRLDYIGLTKGASTFLKGIYKRLENKRIHTNYHPEGTGTGRISSSNPNLQNIPPSYRIIYTADDEEHVLVESDYSQLELIVAAILGGETGLLEEVARGVKPHHVLGEIIFGRPWDQLSKNEQFREKAVLFGTMGGRTARSIAIEFGVPTWEAEQWQALCVNKYPGLLRYKQNVEKEFFETGNITTAFGTTRKISSVTQAYNNPFQGSASFITLTTLNELHKKGFDLRLTVHDSVVLHTKRKEARSVVREMARIVERPIPQLKNYKFQAKYKVGHNWYEMEEV